MEAPVPNVPDKRPWVSNDLTQPDVKVLEQDTTVTILDQEQGPDTGRAETGKIMTTPQYQTYAETMSRLAERHPPAPTPAEVRNQPVMIPGVITQTTNLFRPVAVADLNKESK